MSWTNWYYKPTYGDKHILGEYNWTQICAEIMRLQRIKEEKKIIQETIRRKLMTQEEAQLIPPDFDEVQEFTNGVVKELIGVIGEKIEPLYVEPSKRIGRPQKIRTVIPMKTKAYIVKTRGGICESCKEVPFQQIHHIDGDPSNHDPENLMLMCYQCHKEVERRIKSEKVFK